LQGKGILAAAICTHTFEPMERREREGLGLPDLPVLFIGHPLGGLRAEEVGTRVAETVEAFDKLIPHT
jgi:surfactin synthase thioesterase subunit